MSRNGVVRGYPTVTVKDGAVIYLGGSTETPSTIF